MKNNALHQREMLLPAILIVAVLLLAFGFQGSRGLYAPDEGYYVSLSQAMAETGDYIVPRLHSEPWLDKPPLSLWGTAIGLRLFGMNEWGARVFHGLCYALTTLLVFLFGVSFGGKREGMLTAAFYVTMILPFIAGNIVTPDTPLALWTTAAFYCFWKSVEPGARRVVLWKMLMCAAFGLGFLTKGPAMLIPSAAMFLFLLFQRRTLEYFITPWAVAGVALFCIFGLGWYAYVAHALPGAFDYFLDNQLLGRTISSKYSRNPGLTGALIYAPVILLGTLPWSWLWWKELIQNRKTIFHHASWKNLYNDPQRLFLALWIVVPMTVLCLASSKLPLYALPVFPAFALATARLLRAPAAAAQWLENPWGIPWRTAIVFLIYIMALMGTKYAAAHIPHKKDMRALHALIEQYLPDEQYEIVSIREHLEGLGFYDNAVIERVTTKEDPYPFFVLPEQLLEEVEEMKTDNYHHVLICHGAKHASELSTVLHRAAITFQEVDLSSNEYYLFICDPIESASN
ncbi:glycosyltransferase family 39 protein [Candidatus Sumerlaeota bacterium]|nr:glycosyltransferase family 39 protein [Candidatus Sumerlaeota bacterium]